MTYELTITSETIDEYLAQTALADSTKQVQKSLLNQLVTVYENYKDEKPLAEILNIFINNKSSIKTRVMYNSVTMQYITYLEMQEAIKNPTDTPKVEPEQKPQPEPIKPREIRPRPTFTPQEINFDNLCYFDDSQFFVSQCNEYYPVSDELEIVELALKSNKHICVRGKAGTGKTSLAVFLAKKHNIPVVKVACNDGLKDYHLIGSKNIDSKTDTPKHEAGLLMQAVLLANKYGKCIIILDEANTIKSTTQKVLNPFMDETRFLNINGYGRLELNQGAELFVFGTMNLNYSGTNELNPELKSRFGNMYDMPTIPRETQKKILSKYNVSGEMVEKFIDLVEKLNYKQQINEIDPLTVFSTREQLSALGMIEQGLDDGLDENKLVQMVLKTTFTQKVYESDQQNKIESIIDSTFGRSS